jgi:hypothetical protein
MPFYMALHERLCEPENRGLRRGRNKSTRDGIKLQQSVFLRTMISFGTELDLQRTTRILRDVETDGVERTVSRKPRAAGVPKIASRLQLFVGRFRIFVSGCRAMPLVTVAEGKARPMLPQFGLATFLRYEVRAGQRDSGERHCKSAGRDFNGSVMLKVWRTHESSS